MAQFLVRRLLLIVPVLVGIVFVTFVLVRAIPSDPCRAMLGEKASDAVCDAFRERYGLNDNVLVQFLRFSGNLLQGDLGTSIKYGRPVGDLLSGRTGPDGSGGRKPALLPGIRPGEKSAGL